MDNGEWRNSWLEPKFFSFDASVILLFPLFLISLSLFSMGATKAAAIVFAFVVFGLALEIFVSFVLKVSFRVFLVMLRMKLAGKERKSRRDVFIAKNYDPFGMAGWRIRAYREAHPNFLQDTDVEKNT